MSVLKRLELTNVTAFSSLDLEFSSGLNVIIGGNGTGKTHLLKFLYAACAITEGEGLDKTFGTKLKGVFKPYEGRIGRMAHRAGRSITASIAVSRVRGLRLSASFSNHTKELDSDKVANEAAWKRSPLKSVYIPVKEMLAHAPGFLALTSRRELEFEDVYSDLLKWAYLPKLSPRHMEAKRKRLLTSLQKSIEGKVKTKGEHFFLTNQQGDLEFSLLAEGMRKLALIWLLIQNGTLLDGSILFWDEPETNLNPSFMGHVADVLLELQRMGVQVFLATHDYILLKELDLRKKEKDKILFTSLYRSEAKEVEAQQTGTFLSIDHNAISETFSDLYERDMQRALQGMTQ